MQELGAGATKASLFFGQAAADAGVNDLMDFNTKTLYGDPSKIGPDGKVGSDTGYLGLKGQDALNARPGVEKALDDRIAQIRANLTSPEQQLQFDQYSRRYRNSAASLIGSHADASATTWMTSVNGDTAKLALDRAAQNPNDDEERKHATADLINARMKQAQLSGADTSTIVADSYRDVLKARLESIATDDPSRALDLLKQNRTIAGLDYAPLYDSLRTRANDQQALNLGTSTAKQVSDQATAAAAASPANPAQPVYAQVATAIPGGMSPSGLARTIQLESGGRDVTNASGHVGYGQFSDGTWKEYGAGGDPHNFQDSVAATQRYAAANSKYLTNILGRPPTDAELYLAHMQGNGGAAALLSNPNANAARLVGQDAITGNGGTTSMTAGQFTAMWAHKFNGTTPASGPTPTAPEQSRADLLPVNPDAPESVPAGGIPATPDAVGANLAPPLPTGPAAPAAPAPDAKTQGYQTIMNSDASPEVKQKALGILNQQLQAMAIAADTSTAQRKQKSDTAANTIMQKILNGNTQNILPEIANNPDLTWETRESLTNAARGHAQDSAGGATAAYGPGFWARYKQVNAPVGDPSRIADIATVLKAAAPGGDLTLAGANYLASVVRENASSVDDAAVNATKVSLMQYAKSKISFDTSGMPAIPGSPQRTDAQGERLYNSLFVPNFLKGFDDWSKAGKPPFDYLNKANVDKIAESMRSPREMALAKIEADSQVDTSQVPVPSPPQGVDPDGWKAVIVAPPTSKAGLPYSLQQWTGAVQMLQQNPTPKMRAFFDAEFPNHVLKADDIIDILKPAGMTEDQAAAYRKGNIGEKKSENSGVPPAPPPEDYTAEIAKIL